VSLDDLKTLVDSPSLAASAIRSHPELLTSLEETIRTGLDRKRFPWVTENRAPTEEERRAAILASAALFAAQRTATLRRSEGKRAQEEAVRTKLLASGLSETSAPSRGITTVSQAPQPGAFCTETVLGKRKADLVIRLWDERIMPIECKVSNSSINSVKRLNNDAAAKAEEWITDFGQTQVVPVAVLGGVYKLHNLENAQARGLTLFWAHRLEDLADWIESTRER
jgi:hypothetical protein